MISKRTKKAIMLLVGSIVCFGVGIVFAADAPGSGVGKIAENVAGNLGAIAKLITAGAYVAGFGFAVAAILKFKAHKDNPTQVPVSNGIVYLFAAAALMFTPAVFKATGSTLFNSNSGKSSVSGITSF